MHPLRFSLLLRKMEMSFFAFCLAGAAASQYSSGSVSHNSAVALGLCVSSSIASKWSQPAPPTLTAGVAQRGFVTLSRSVSPLSGAILPPSLSVSIPSAQCLHKDEMWHKCVQTSLPVNQRRLDLLVHARTLFAPPPPVCQLPFEVQVKTYTALDHMPIIITGDKRVLFTANTPISRTNGDKTASTRQDGTQIFKSSSQKKLISVWKRL